MPSSIPLIAKIFYRDPSKEAPDGLFVVRSEPDYVRLSLEDRERFRRSIDGAGWDRVLNRWSIRKDQLLSTVQRLEAANIHVAPHAMVLPYLVREDTDAVERVTEAETSIEELEIKLARKGHTLFDFQRSDIRYMASRNRVFNANEPGLGKASRLSEPVLTPTGFKPIGSVKKGDKVIGADGRPTVVTGVYHRGKLQTFTVTFSDGSSTNCCDDHLWLVQDKNARTRGSGYEVKPLREIRARLRNKWNWLHYIPIVQPVQFEERSLPLDPYLLGVLLGDGGLKYGVMISNPDAHVIVRCTSALPDGVWFRDTKNANGCDYAITSGETGVKGSNEVLNQMKILGLHGKGSEEKFVPSFFKHASIKNRIDLLHGLMDTDGYVSADGITVEFSSSSRQLAEDVVFLVRSLGGIGTIKTKKAFAVSTSETGEKIRKQGLDCHMVRVRLPAEINPFSLPRKRDRVLPRSKYPVIRMIVDVQPAEIEECVCISVDATDHLYVTNDFIVTHNTIESLCALPYGAAVLVACPKEAKSVWERECLEWRDDFVPTVIEKKSQLRMPAAHELIIVNYDILSPCKADALPAPLTLICDEVHKLKTAGANRTAAAKSYAIRADRIFALTGTPLPNRPNELWSILAVFGLEREVFGTKDRLIELFHGKQTYYYTSSPCDKCRGDGFHNNPDPLGEPLKCSYCRGGMRSIPKASGMRWSVCPTNIHRFTDERGRVRRSPDWTPAPLGCEVAFSKQTDSTALVDPAITPTSVPTPYDHAKPADNASCPVCHGQPMPPDPQIAELLKRVMIRHEKIDVLKDLPAKIYKVMSVPLDKKIIKEVDASIEAEVRTALLEAEDLDEVKELHAGLMRGRRVLAEAKIAYAQQLLDEWEADNVVSLVFSAHRAPIEQISMRAGWVAIIGGSTLDRGQVQRDFQAGKYRGLAGTIGAASTALTLTLATRELFIDRAWTPADNDQAEDRAHRIGQTAGLIIVDLVAEHPIDRHVHILNHRKRGIIRASIGRVRGDRDVNLPLLKAIQRAGKK